MRLPLALALIALTTPTVAETPAPGPTITLTGGEPMAVPGTGVTLLLTGITDQRCPADVDCYWEGMIRAEITVTSATGSTDVILCNLCDGATNQATARGLALWLQGLAPSTSELAALGRAPRLTDYALTVTYGTAP